MAKDKIWRVIRSWLEKLRLVRWKPPERSTCPSVPNGPIVLAGLYRPHAKGIILVCHHCHLLMVPPSPAWEVISSGGYWKVSGAFYSQTLLVMTPALLPPYQRKG